ncbi:MAG TPA: SAM hydroxide adenosyltransferase, partial [Casimicrobiaceae bacterium]|nr:SAM hydroxide adenosyltransferase [Casimicrobiaceae bacterium]
APVAALIAQRRLPADRIDAIEGLSVQFGAEDLSEVIYIDHYGNALTGLRAALVTPAATLAVRGQRLSHARVFGEAPVGEAFWYENSIGLVEIAANRASAAELLGIDIGDGVSVT